VYFENSAVSGNIIYCRGVLALSEFTGASVVLDGAVLTNPYSHRRMDEAIDQALAMPSAEQQQRMRKMSAAVEAFTVSDWAEEQMGALREDSGAA